MSVRLALSRLTLGALIAPLLSGCVLLPPRPGESAIMLYGTRVTYSLVDARDFYFCPADRVGCSVPLGSVCFVMIDRAFFERADPRQRTLVVAHEVGHCLDLRKLSLSHGGFRNEGQRWGAYWATPSEGYAEAYGRLYLRRCGPDLASLGWNGERGSCTPPDPREVTPGLVDELKL